MLIVAVALVSLSAVVYPSEADLRPADGLGIALAGFTAVPLAWRRSHPVLAVAMAFGSLFTLSALGYGTGQAIVGGLVALYSVSRSRGPRTSLLAFVVAETAMALTLLILLAGSASLAPDQVVVALALCPVAWRLGSTQLRLRNYSHRLEETARRLQQEQEANAHRAVAEERTRIARELHDIVAHHVALIAVQAGAAQALLRANSGAVETTLHSIHHSSRDALTEMRRIIGILRRSDEAEERMPQPGLVDIRELVGRAFDAGLEAELTACPAPGRVPATIELAAYRIVQEALTNAMRHAGPTRVRVSVHAADGLLRVEIDDDGHGSATATATSGRGLMGMRERTTMLGGSLDAGPREDGGFAVRAVIPLRGEDR